MAQSVRTLQVQLTNKPVKAILIIQEPNWQCSITRASLDIIHRLGPACQGSKNYMKKIQTQENPFRCPSTQIHSRTFFCQESTCYIQQ
jgi:hypothetical protein